MLRTVCDFLGEPFDAAMLAYAELGAPAFRDQPYREGVLRPLFDSSLEAWRRELSPAQVRLVQRLTPACMARYGYPAEPVPLRALAGLPPQALRELLAWLRFKREEARRLAAEPGIRFRARAVPLYQLMLDLLRHRGPDGYV